MGKVVAEQKEGTQERDGQKGVVGWGEGGRVFRRKPGGTKHLCC